jgi:hypothetical protein
MTLKDLLKQGEDISNKLSSGDIPLFINRVPVNINLELEKDCDNRYWINIAFTNDVSVLQPKS